MKTFFKFVACAVIFCHLSSATVVVYQWTPTEIFIGADSLFTQSAEKGLTSFSGCKFHQVGDVFFVVTGMMGDTSIGLDIADLATQAILSARAFGLPAVIERFDFLAHDQIAKIPSGLTYQTGLKLSVPTDKVAVLFASTTEHAMGIVQYNVMTDGTVRRLPTTVKGTGQYEVVDLNISGDGDYAEAWGAVKQHPEWIRGGSVNFVVEFIKFQVDFEKKRFKLHHARAFVGGATCILRIAGGKASWVSGYQGSCPSVQ